MKGKGHGKKAAVWGGALVLVLAGMLVGGGVYFSKRPNFDRFLPAFSSPVQVIIVNPASGRSFPADSYILIQVTAQSELPISQVELWVNGTLFETQSSSAQGTTKMLSQWHWQAGKEGSYALLARAVDVSGHAGVSDAVNVEVTKAAGYNQLVFSQAGDSLTSLADKYGTTPEKILGANPQIGGGGAGQAGSQGEGAAPSSGVIDLNQILPPNTIIFIPHMSLPIISQNPPPGNPGNENQGDQGGQSSGNQDTGFPTFFDKLAFQLKQYTNPDSDAPAAPTITKITNYPGQDPCRPWFSWPYSEKADGYYVYRQNVRVATEPKLYPNHPFLIDDYSDGDHITGVFTYVVSAFNTAGESFSNPLTYDLSQCVYTPIGSKYATEESVTGGVGLDNGVLTMPASVDLAYLYVGVNGVFWERIPPGSSNFLSGSGYQFDLNEYLGGLIDKIEARDLNVAQTPDLDITIEVWGWQGGEVGLVGTYNAKIHRIVLAACSQEGQNQCQGVGGSAPWAREASFSPDRPAEDQFFNLSLASSQYLSPSNPAQEVKLYLEVAVQPFSAMGGHDLGVLHENSSNANLSLPITPGALQYLDFSLSHYSKEFSGMISPPGGPFTLYLRVYSLDQDGNYGIPSNAVELHYKSPFEPPETYAIASALPSLYTVEILKDSYQVPVFINYNTWGCVIVQNSAEDYNPGDIVCPPARDLGDDSFWGQIEAIAKGVWEGVTGAFDDLLSLWNQVKDGIVNAVASVIPGCDDTCVSALHHGLDIGITALTGIPPNLPNFDDLSSQGILYAVDQVQSSLTGYECGSDCVSVLKGQLAQLIHDARQAQSQPNCFAADQVFYFYGKQPGWCLPPDVEVKPFPGGSNQPGMVLVKITRNSIPAPAGDLQQMYKLNVDVTGINTARNGTFGNDCKYDANGYPVPDDYKNAPYLLDAHAFTDHEEGRLFNQVSIPMPQLNPGDSIIIPITLQPIGSDNSKLAGALPSVMGCDGFAKFKYLFYKGTSSITAAEYCYESVNNVFVPCTQGGKDTFATPNPQDQSDQWVYP